MRLLKLAAYCALGYLAYEFYQGLAHRGHAVAGEQTPGSEDLRRALNEDRGRMMNMTGPAGGTTMRTESSAGGAGTTRVVGRGVVH